ncbi:MAG: DNA/RNA non-specific endonuclease, partial [Bacteroidia bacterium]
MLKKRIWAFVILFGLMLNSNLLVAQKQALTNDGKKVVLYANYTWKYDTAVLTIPEKLELPEFKNNQNITYHNGFTLCYNKTHEQSIWVAYQLTAAETQGTAQRSNKFEPDPKVKGGTATDADYKQSGYDRGHLAPAADMSWSEEAMQESFYYSNMSPQVPSFNRGIWKKLEEQVRDWALQFDEVYVATGPILTSGLPRIGPNKVSVPSLYYKALLVYGNKGKQAIAFVLPNEASQQPLNNYIITIDSLENLTGIKAHTLRVWEQRYGIVVAQRKESNHRFYDNEDLKKVLRIAYLYHQGYKISKIALLDANQIKTLAINNEKGNAVDILVNTLLEASIDFDETQFETSLDFAFKQFGFEKTILQVIYPYLEKIGIFWMIDNIIPAQEHFSSNIIRHKIIAATEKIAKPLSTSKKQVVLFTPLG